MENFEIQYANSLKRILNNGVLSNNRTNVKTIAIQHQYFYFKDIVNNFPVIRGKKVYPRMALVEMIWMLLGNNNVKWLEERKVNYWSKFKIKDLETAKNHNLKSNYWIDTIGKSYGYQYRSFNGTDQVKDLLINMLYNTESRRHIINLWNSSELNQMVLPPCLYDFHFECINKSENELYVDLHSHVRSNDSFLGAPYDFMFCAWLTYIICEYLNQYQIKNIYIPRDIHYTADNYHLYQNHIDACKKYLANVEENKFNVINKQSKICNKLELEKGIKNIDDYLKLIDKNIYNINEQKLYIDKNSEFEYGNINAALVV